VTHDLTLNREIKKLDHVPHHQVGELPAVGASADDRVQLMSILCWSALQIERKGLTLSSGVTSCLLST
jgi:hypothetical protein